jgi:hypothetical protein
MLGGMPGQVKNPANENSVRDIDSRRASPFEMLMVPVSPPVAEEL